MIHNERVYQPLSEDELHMNEPQSEANAYTIRLELVDEPGELLRALHPIGANGGNLLSIYHERGHITPRGHIPVEIDLEATPKRYETIVDKLREEGINVIQAGTERYSESLTVLLSGDLVDTGLSDTLTRIRETTNVTIADFELSAPQGSEDISSGRLRLGIEEGKTEHTLSKVREIASEKDIRVIEPLSGGFA